MEISTHAKEAAKQCLEYDLMGIIIAHNRDALNGELPFEWEIQSAIDAATAEKDQRIAELTVWLDFWRSAFETYGAHSISCFSRNFTGDKPTCECGFFTIQRKLTEETKEKA